MRLIVTLLIIVSCFLFQLSCTKTKSSIPPPPPPDPCSIANISLNGVVVNPSVPGAADGSITVSASGGTNFTFNINGGTFKSSGSFTNLTAGSYTIVGKNSDGCMASIVFILTNPTISCSSVNISVSSGTTTNIPCETNSASIIITASGGVAPYTYSLDGGAYQAQNIFANVVSGSHVIVAKDANGCSGTTSTTVNNQPAGTLFTQVKGIIQYYCLYCHNTTTAGGGVSFSQDCNIVTNKLRIQARAVDGNPTPMPQAGLIPSTDRQKIINWINAGGTFAN